MPAYPTIAATAHIEGDVRACFVVDADRTVASVEIVSGPPPLRGATLDNIWSWKFAPASEKSTPDKSYHTVFYYRISPRGACEYNRRVTVSTASFHEVAMTGEVPKVMAVSESKVSQPPNVETTSHQ